MKIRRLLINNIIICMAHQRGNEQSATSDTDGWPRKIFQSWRGDDNLCELWKYLNIISIFAFLNYCIQNSIQLSVTRRDKDHNIQLRCSTTTSQFNYVRSRHNISIIHTSLTVEVHGTTETETKRTTWWLRIYLVRENKDIQLYVLVATITSHAIMMCALHAFNVHQKHHKKQKLCKYSTERLWRPFVQLICNYYDQQTCTASLEFWLWINFFKIFVTIPRGVRAQEGEGRRNHRRSDID